MRTLLPLLLSVACSEPEPERALHVDQDTPAPAEVWTPDEDTGLVDPWELESSASCGSTQSLDPTEGDDVLAMDFCHRISPEPDQVNGGVCTDDTGGAGGELAEAAGADGEPPPPCGFTNLLGAVVAAGDPATPATLYCDADEEGGVRYTHLSGASGETASQLLVPQTCYSDVDTGAAIPVDGGVRLVWLDIFATPGIVSGVLGDDGSWDGGTTPVYFEGTARQLQAAGAWLIVSDTDAKLWALPITDGDIGGPALPLDTSARTLGVTATETGSAVVSCADSGEAAVLTLLDDSGITTQQVLELECGWQARPGLAWSGSLLAVTLHDDDGATLILVDGTGAETARVTLGEDALHPTVAWTGTAFLTADSSGALRTLDETGATLGSWVHPDIADHQGSPAAVRLTVADGQWGFTFMGFHTDFTSAGHANTFYYLEQSAVAAP